MFKCVIDSRANEVVCNFSYGDRGSGMEMVNIQVGIDCTHDIDIWGSLSYFRTFG